MAHAVQCASHQFKYSGDRRNAPDGDIRLNCDCDGFHTFDELYDHRITLFIALCKIIFQSWAPPFNDVWRSKLHSDGSSFDGWFVVGIHHATGTQITYHLPMARWSETNFIPTLDRAPEWDGHTSDEVLMRLKDL